MSTENLEIQIDANVQQAVKAIEDLAKSVNVDLKDGINVIDAFEDKIKSLQDAVKNAKTSTELAKLNTQLKATESALSQIKSNKFSSEIKDVDKTVNKTGATFTNFNRILSDSPYGFIGIANNIEPLLDSFKRLSAETGGAKNAFKSLLSGLAGGGGLGLAFSAALAGVQFLTLGFDRWTGSSKNAAKATKEAADAANFFASSVAVDITKVNVLAGLIDDTNRSYTDRKKALDELRKTYPAYLQGLSDEKALTEGVQGAVDLLTKSIIKRGIIAAYQEKINKQIADGLEAAKKEQEQYTTTTEEFNSALEKNASSQTKLLTKQEQNTANYKEYVNFVTANKAPTQFIFDRVTKSIKPLVDEMLSLGGSTDEVLGKFGKGLDETKKKTKELKEELQKTFGESTDFAGSNIVFQAIVKYNEAQAKKDFDGIQQIVNTFRDGVKIPASLGNLKMDPGIKKMVDDFAAETARLKAIGEQFKQIVTNIAIDAATAIGEGIGNLLSGSKNPFTSLIEVLANGLKSLGQMYIKIGVEMLLAQKALKAIAKNPYLTIAAGIALEALGTILQNKARAETKFAEGGIVSGPLNAQIGEAGQSEVILPLSRLSGMLSNGRGVVVMESRISGQDLLLVQARAAGSRGRTYG